MTATSNGANGLEVSPEGSVTLEHFLAADNGRTEPAEDTGNGVLVKGRTYFKMRDSVLRDNASNGFLLHDPTAAGIVRECDLGSAPSPPGAGNNAFYGNGAAGLCLLSHADSVTAQGNTFSEDSSKDCRMSSLSPVLSRDSTCAGGIDVGLPVWAPGFFNNCKSGH